MENVFKGSKRVIATILTLGILLGFAGTCVYAVSEMPEANTVVTEEPAQELVPLMARGCSGNYSSKFLGTPNTTVLDTSAAYQSYIHFDSFGIADYTIHYMDHGNPTYHTNPHYHTFSFVNGWWTPTEYHSGLPY